MKKLIITFFFLLFFQTITSENSLYVGTDSIGVKYSLKIHNNEFSFTIDNEIIPVSCIGESYLFDSLLICDCCEETDLSIILSSNFMRIRRHIFLYKKNNEMLYFPLDPSKYIVLKNIEK